MLQCCYGTDNALPLDILTGQGSSRHWYDIQTWIVALPLIARASAGHVLVPLTKSRIASVNSRCSTPWITFALRRKLQSATVHEEVRINIAKTRSKTEIWRSLQRNMNVSPFGMTSYRPKGIYGTKKDSKKKLGK
jgi:hypothetical protein